MNTLYLIRHGQAGPRHNYDELSELGQRQAELLGRYLAEQSVSFGAVYTGGLKRQRQTARIVCDAVAFPSDISTDLRWNEFSLAAVYQGLVPRLCAESEEFARDYEEMRQALIDDPHATRGAAGRCDRAVVQAWIENRFPDYEGGSWATFRARVQSIDACAADDNVAVFTSATPIGIRVGAALGLTNEKILGLMSVLYNSSVTTLKRRAGEWWLFNFNTTPHLAEEILRTFR